MRSEFDVREVVVLLNLVMCDVCELKCCGFCPPLFTFTGAGEPNFDGLDANPYRSAKQRQEWEVKALLEKVQPELISLDPAELGQVDRATFEQRHKDRVQALVSVWKHLIGIHQILSVHFQILTLNHNTSRYFTVTAL